MPSASSSEHRPRRSAAMKIVWLACGIALACAVHIGCAPGVPTSASPHTSSTVAADAGPIAIAPAVPAKRRRPRLGDPVVEMPGRVHMLEYKWGETHGYMRMPAWNADESRACVDAFFSTIGLDGAEGARRMPRRRPNTGFPFRRHDCRRCSRDHATRALRQSRNVSVRREQRVLRLRTKGRRRAPAHRLEVLARLHVRDAPPQLTSSGHVT